MQPSPDWRMEAARRIARLLDEDAAVGDIYGIIAQAHASQVVEANGALRRKYAKARAAATEAARLYPSERALLHVARRSGAGAALAQAVAGALAEGAALRAVGWTEEAPDA